MATARLLESDAERSDTETRQLVSAIIPSGAATTSQPDVKDSADTKLARFQQIAALESNFPWLVGEHPDQEALRDMLLKKENQWFVEWLKKNPLPERYQVWSYRTFALVMGLALALLICPFLYDGSKNAGLIYILGTLIANIIQNVGYGYFSCLFFRNPGDALNLVLGVLLSAPPTVASALQSYHLSGFGWKTFATAGGNFPMIVYGMAGTVQKVRNRLTNKPELRKFWNDDLARIVDELKLSKPEVHADLRDCVIDIERRQLTKIAGAVVGFGLGLALGTSLTGYVYAAYLASREFTSENWSIAIASISNLPTIIIAFLESGFELGVEFVNKAADILTFLFSEFNIEISAGYARFMVLCLLSVSGIGFFSAFSNATSMALAAGIEIASPILKAFVNFCIEDGTCFFNGVMSSKMAIKYLEFRHTVNEKLPMEQFKKQLVIAKQALGNVPVSGLPKREGSPLQEVKVQPSQRVDDNKSHVQLVTRGNFAKPKKPARTATAKPEKGDYVQLAPAPRT